MKKAGIGGSVGQVLLLLLTFYSKMPQIYDVDMVVYVKWKLIENNQNNWRRNDREMSGRIEWIPKKPPWLLQS